MTSSATSDSQTAILAVDQGTSCTKGLAIGLDGRVLAQARSEIGQSHPRPGWVQQDAEEILASVLTVLEQLIDGLDVRVAAVALANQRESAIAWDRSSGQPLCPLLGWQDRRTSTRAAELGRAGVSEQIQARTGLPLDPMFSALKFEWLLDRIDPDRSRARHGEILLGTVDSFIVHRLTGRHSIEAGNASRTQLLDVQRMSWDDELLELFRIPPQALPEVVDSNTRLPFARGLRDLSSLNLNAVLGDSHAALYGHGVRHPGAVKATYGTGSSIMGLMADGSSVGVGLARTVAWQLDGSPTHAFEGNILATGATIAWLARVFDTTPGELFEIARDVEVLHGVDLVPAFAGLAAPWWADQAQAILSGFTLGTDRAVVARAAIDSIVLQIDDVLDAAQLASGAIALMLADGGPSRNDWLMQLQADISRRVVRRSRLPELSAFGAARLAADSVGMPIDVQAIEGDMDEFRPQFSPATAQARRALWRAAVERALARPLRAMPVRTMT